MNLTGKKNLESKIEMEGFAKKIVNPWIENPDYISDFYLSFGRLKSLFTIESTFTPKVF